MTTCKISELLSPAFYEIHRAIKAEKINELVAKGGRGSTKSSAIGGIELPLMLLKHSDCHAVVLRKYGNTLRSSVYAQVCWGISALGLTNKFKCTVSPMEITCLLTGQKIYFFGLDDPGKLKSIKVPFGYIGIVWFEELDQFDSPEQVRNVEQSCLRGGPFSFTFKSFNPPAMARNWANRYVLEEKPGKLVHHSTYLTTPREWLGPRFLADAEHLKEKNETAYRHEYLGEVVGSGSAVFENLKLEPIPDEMVRSFDRRLGGSGQAEAGVSIQKGDLVKIAPGAVYYNGAAIPSWVKNQSWYVSQVSGDRAVIDKNESGTSSICSPVNTKYLSAAGSTGAAPAPSEPKKIEAGGKVKVTGSQYTNGVAIPSYVKGNTYTVQQVKSDRVLLKEIYSWVPLSGVQAV